MTRTKTLSKVMKAAWTIFRMGGRTFSQALTQAWAWAKKSIVAAATTFSFDMEQVIRESDKAVCIRTNMGRPAWVPKSAIVEIQPYGNNPLVTVHAWFRSEMIAKGF